MRASVAGFLAACALIGIPRLAGELREYKNESQKPAPVAVSVPPQSDPAASVAHLPKALDAAAVSKPAPVPKIPDASVLPKLTPVQLVAMQPDPLPLAGAGTKPASPANEAELVPAIQKELARLGFYDGPITDKWSRPVRSAVQEFLRRTGSRARSPQPTAGLLTALQAAEPVKKQAAQPPEVARPEEKHVRQSEAVVVETPLQQNAAGAIPAARSDDYLPPWMTAKTDQARYASKSEAARSDERVEAMSPELAEAPSSFDDTPKRYVHRRHHAERLWKGKHISHRGYDSRRRAPLFPF